MREPRNHLLKRSARISFVSTPSRPLYGTSSPRGGSARYIFGRPQVEPIWGGYQRESKADVLWVSKSPLTGFSPWERKQVNERPIYLRSVFLMLALLQTFTHLHYDYDKVYLPGDEKFRSPQQRSVIVLSPTSQLKAIAPSLVQRVAIRSVLVSIASPFVFALFIRKTAWAWTLALARILWDLPAAAELSYIPPYHISLLLRCVGSSFLLILLWESSNAIFSVFVAQKPLKNGVPLTEGSKDPNGSLLNGLKSNKDVAKVCNIPSSTDRALTIIDFCILGTIANHAALRSQTKDYFRRY